MNDIRTTENWTRALRGAALVVLVAPVIAGCGTSSSQCASAIRQAQRTGRQIYLRQLHVPGQTRVNAERMGIVTGQSALIQWNYDHKGTCSWDRSYSPSH